MDSPAILVLEFHRRFDLNDTRGIRVRLMTEEVNEYLRAEESDDTVRIAHELADIVYAAYGTALTYGIDLDKCIAEIHESNLSKMSSSGSIAADDNGKVLKGDSYAIPDLRRFVGGRRSDLGLQ